MATATARQAASTPDVTMVDPRAPRFGQALTASGMVLGIALTPAFVYAVATVLVLAVVSGWRVDAYATLWRRGMLPLVGRPADREPAAPHRFARLVGAGMTLLASLAFLAGFALVGSVLAAVVAVLAGLAAVTGICVGCRFYRQVSFVRRLGLV
ncbi:DUF4395 family protein [Halomarina rubra]|uniref:DUF4395 family protein n=1 Tax=Halomarina rubra TaxID=2071873 RepID=A0ABD6ASC6_9EURY|nr:DUF4395 family protein [Halomarina rubra]